MAGTRKSVIGWAAAVMAAALCGLSPPAAAQEPAPPGKAKPGAKPAKSKDKPKEKAAKARRPTHEETEAAMAFFGLPDGIGLNGEQRGKLHELYEEAAPELFGQAGKIQVTQGRAVQQARAESGWAGRGGRAAVPVDPGTQERIGKMRQEMAGQQAAYRDRVLAILTPKQRVRIDPALKDWKPPAEEGAKEEEAKPKPPSKKAKK